MTRIAILASGNGTDCEAVMEAVERGQIRDAIVAVVIADRPAGVLERARHHGVTGLLVDRRSLGTGFIRCRLESRPGGQPHRRRRLCRISQRA